MQQSHIPKTNKQTNKAPVVSAVTLDKVDFTTWNNFQRPTDL